MGARNFLVWVFDNRTSRSARTAEAQETFRSFGVSPLLAIFGQPDTIRQECLQNWTRAQWASRVIHMISRGRQSDY